MTLTGEVVLTGSTLALSQSYTTVTGDSYTIVSGTSVTGTFTGLANNAIVGLNGRALRINYYANNVVLTDTGAAPASYTLTVQNGSIGRSYIRYVTAVFPTGTSTDALDYVLASIGTASPLLTLTNKGLGGTDSTAYNLTGKVTRSTTNLNFDFGSEGIGGFRNLSTGDGTYVMAVDALFDGSQIVSRNFIRLAGDVNGDGEVTTADFLAARGAIMSQGSNLPNDANGDGIVNAFDILMTTKYRGRKITPPV